MMYIGYTDNSIDNRIKDLRISLLDNIREDVEVSVRYETEMIDSLIIVIENKLKYISVSLNSKFCNIGGKNKISGEEDTKTIIMAISLTSTEDKIRDIVNTIGKLFEIKNHNEISDKIMWIYDYIPSYYNESYFLPKEIIKNTILQALLDGEIGEDNEYKSIQ